MTDEQLAHARPTHRVYAVEKRPHGTKPFWHEIGAAWPHSKGSGFSLKLNFVPLDPDFQIVIREITVKPEADHDAAD